MDISTLRVPGLLTISVFLWSCGGGGGSNGELLHGVFLDSPVSGLSFTTGTVSGVTDAEGGFVYREGETVVFSIGNLALPAVAGAGLVTPLDVAASDDITDPMVINIARLLQSLDEDNDPENGILIPGQVAEVFTDTAVFDPTDDQSVDNIVQQLYGTDRQTVSVELAVNHFVDSLSAAAGSTGSLDQLHYLVPADGVFAGGTLFVDQQSFDLSVDGESHTGSVSINHGVYQFESNTDQWFVSISNATEVPLACVAKSPVSVADCNGDLYHLFKDQQLAIDFAVTDQTMAVATDTAIETDTAEELPIGAANEETIDADVQLPVDSSGQVSGGASEPVLAAAEVDTSEVVDERESNTDLTDLVDRNEASTGDIVQPAVTPDVVPEVQVQSGSEPTTEPDVSPEPIVEVSPQPELEVSPEPIVEVAPQPEPEVIPEPIVEVSPQLAPEVIPEPIVEVSPQLAPEVSPEPIVEVSPQPEPEVSPELIVEVSPQPEPEVSPEPIVEVTPQPEPEVSPEPIVGVAQQPEPEVIPEPVVEVTPQPEPELSGIQPSDITDIIVLTGQANAAALQTDFDPGIDTGHDRLFAYNQDGQWRVAELNQYWDVYLPSNFSSVEDGREPYNNLAFQLGKSLAEQSDRVVGIIMITAVGEGISHWDFNSSFYRSVRSKVTAALAQLPQKTAVDAMIWMQGETDWLAEGSADGGATGFVSTDSDFYRNYYPNKLRQLISNLRSEVWFAHSAQFICGETKRAQLNPHLMALNDDGDKRTSCAAASDLPTRASDEFDIHFSAEGLRTLGGRMAELYFSADQ